MPWHCSQKAHTHAAYLWEGNGSRVTWKPPKLRQLGQRKRRRENRRWMRWQSASYTPCAHAAHKSLSFLRRQILHTALFPKYSRPQLSHFVDKREPQQYALSSKNIRPQFMHFLVIYRCFLSWKPLSARATSELEVAKMKTFQTKQAVAKLLSLLQQREPRYHPKHCRNCAGRSHWNHTLKSQILRRPAFDYGLANLVEAISAEQLTCNVTRAI